MIKFKVVRQERLVRLQLGIGSVGYDRCECSFAIPEYDDKIEQEGHSRD